MKDWLVDILGLDPDFARGLQIVIAFIVILALIGIFMWVLAKIKGMRMETGRRSRQPRLAVMDSTPIDNQRRLVLIRRDTVEHLVLVGGETDIVVEQSIVRGAPVSAHPQRQPFPAAVQQAAAGQPPAPAQPQVVAPQAAPAQQTPAPVQTAPSPKAPASGAPAPGPQRPRAPAPQQRPPAPRQAGPGPQSPASQPPSGQTPSGQTPSGQPVSSQQASGQPGKGQQLPGASQPKVPVPDGEPRSTGTPPPPVSTKPTPQNRVGSLAQKAKTGLVGATAGALGLGAKKEPQAPNGQPSVQEGAQSNTQSGTKPNAPENALSESRDMPTGAGDRTPQSSSAPSSSGGRPQTDSTAAPQPASTPNVAPPPETASEKTGSAPEIDLERAMGNAIGQESASPKSAPVHAPAPESSAIPAPEKLSPKDELAHQLEALLNTPPLVTKSPSVTPPEVSKEAPQPQPAAEPTIETAEPQQSAPPVSLNPVPAPDRAPEIAAQKSDETKTEAETTSAGMVRPPEKSPPSTTDKTIPASMPAPQVEPRFEPKMPEVSAPASPASNALSDLPNASAAPDVASPVAPEQRPASSAPEPKLGPAGPAASGPAASGPAAKGPEGAAPKVDGPGTGDEKSDSIASIEEEMAKLLSELSGPPKN